MNVSLHIGMIASCTKCSCCPKYRIKLNPKTEKSNVQFESQTAKNKKLWETSKRSWNQPGGGVGLLQAGAQPKAELGRDSLPPLARQDPPPIKGGAGLLLDTQVSYPLN